MADLGKVLTEALKLKVKYNANVTYGIIVTPHVDRIVTVVPLGPDAGIESNDYMLNAVVVKDAVVVYEDVFGRYHVAVPHGVDQKYIDLLNKVKVVKANPAVKLREVMAEAISKDCPDTSVVQAVPGYGDRILKEILSRPDVVYYTDEIRVDDLGMPESGFYVIGDGGCVAKIIISDKGLLDLAARLVVELQGFEVANEEQLLKAFKALAGKFYITREDVEEQFGRNETFVDMSPLPEFIIHFHAVIYLRGFKATVEGGDLVFKKGVLALSYQYIMASPDVWELIDKNLDKLFPS